MKEEDHAETKEKHADGSLKPKKPKVIRTEKMMTSIKDESKNKDIIYGNMDDTFGSDTTHDAATPEKNTNVCWTSDQTRRAIKHMLNVRCKGKLVKGKSLFEVHRSLTADSDIPWDHTQYVLKNR